MFFLFFFFCFFWFFIFFFPSSDFYFVEEVRVQSGTPAPARERVAVRYFVEEMGTGMEKGLSRYGPERKLHKFAEIILIVSSEVDL